MPLYDYFCPRCDATFEEYATLPCRDSILCPECSGPVERQLPLFALHGIEHPYDWGKQDPIVSYPGGVTKQKSYNELYSTGGL